MNGPAIKINDKDYEFNVDPEIIERAEKSKFYGREDEFPFDHIADLHDLSVLFGKDEINQRHYFLKLFPFSLGGSAKTCKKTDSWEKDLKTYFSFSKGYRCFRKYTRVMKSYKILLIFLQRKYRSFNPSGGDDIRIDSTIFRPPTWLIAHPLAGGCPTARGGRTGGNVAPRRS